jgi:protein-S-isoprenylcysteine O-methyltransferase Ste14
MNPPFVYALIVLFVFFVVKYLFVSLQVKDKRVSRWFGKNAFVVQTGIHLVLMFFASYLFILAVLGSEGHFSSRYRWLEIAGFVYMMAGIIVFFWASSLLGFRQSFGSRFFGDKATIVKTSLYKYVKNPMYSGIASIYLGFALWQNSWYGIIFAVEYAILAKILANLENRGLYEKL